MSDAGPAINIYSVTSYQAILLGSLANLSVIIGLVSGTGSLLLPLGLGGPRYYLYCTQLSIDFLSA